MESPATRGTREATMKTRSASSPAGPRRWVRLGLFFLSLSSIAFLATSWWEIEARWFVRGLRERLPAAEIVGHQGDLADGLRLRIRTAKGELVLASGGDDAFSAADGISVWEVAGEAPLISSYRLSSEGETVPYGYSIRHGMLLRELRQLDDWSGSTEQNTAGVFKDLEHLVASYERIEAAIRSLPVCPDSRRLTNPGWVTRTCRVPAEKQFELGGMTMAQAIHARADGASELAPPLKP